MRTQSRYISSGHLLIALADAGSDPTAELLRSFGAQPETIRAEVVRLLKTEVPDLPETPQLMSVVGQMLEVARGLNHEYVDTEHLLVGLLHDRNCLALRALEAAGVVTDNLRDEVLRRMVPGSAEAVKHRMAVEARLSDHPDVVRLKRSIAELQRKLEEAAAAGDFQKAREYRDKRIAEAEQLKRLYNDLGHGG